MMNIRKRSLTMVFQENEYPIGHAEQIYDHLRKRKRPKTNATGNYNASSSSSETRYQNMQQCAENEEFFKECTQHGFNTALDGNGHNIVIAETKSQKEEILKLIPCSCNWHFNNDGKYIICPID